MNSYNFSPEFKSIDKNIDLNTLGRINSFTNISKSEGFLFPDIAQHNVKKQVVISDMVRLRHLRKKPNKLMEILAKNSLNI